MPIPVPPVPYSTDRVQDRRPDNHLWMMAMSAVYEALQNAGQPTQVPTSINHYRETGEVPNFAFPSGEDVGHQEEMAQRSRQYYQPLDPNLGPGMAPSLAPTPPSYAVTEPQPRVAPNDLASRQALVRFLMQGN